MAISAESRRGASGAANLLPSDRSYKKRGEGLYGAWAPGVNGTLTETETHCPAYFLSGMCVYVYLHLSLSLGGIQVTFAAAPTHLSHTGKFATCLCIYHA